MELPYTARTVLVVLAHGSVAAYDDAYAERDSIAPLAGETSKQAGDKGSRRYSATQHRLEIQHTQSARSHVAEVQPAAVTRGRGHGKAQ
jgi:hypothetical protein